MAKLLAAWEALIARHGTSPLGAEIGRELLASWSEPHRRYHNIAHLDDVLRRVDELAAHAADLDAVLLAAWYHDAVYAGQPDDEENSARRAETELTALGLPPALIGEVVRLVRLTATHDPARGDRNGQTLSDADLAILAAPADRYATYTAAIRAEYAHVPDDAFRSGRKQIVRRLLGGSGVYRTPRARQHWEHRALANLRAELGSLTAPADHG
ncbi:metal-dependent phosphohydrolase [Mycobacterium shimoidei]|nr:metal-dependent phosphohydrolase [Mycobacterium shimoidei]ODR15528.1 metal-dependent phosphohydrolase [Mycobacterium shimoidei]ORW80066.1 metal-dependent phosphohydrolase [Mycobacterium shimoidei]